MRRTPAGRRPFATWTYGLHVSIEYDATSAPNAEQALAGLTPARVVHVEDEETNAFPTRFDARFESMRRLGAFAQAHPIFESFLRRDLRLTAPPGQLTVAFGGDSRGATARRHGAGDRRVRK